MKKSKKSGEKITERFEIDAITTMSFPDVEKCPRANDLVFKIRIVDGARDQLARTTCPFLDKDQEEGLEPGCSELKPDVGYHKCLVNSPYNKQTVRLKKRTPMDDRTPIDNVIIQVEKSKVKA